ncbi:hypothetical protein [Endozoicomonas sp. ONNA2]|uniref:hypothetical protein n=1 Tax=Endozoicomonas sp. ONNA2 TaxID=2828741 RepID=UPI0021489851|nr:hypothetical protein [Endozoicomonas sp. ONNA2]
MFSPTGSCRTLNEPLWPAVCERSPLTAKKENENLKARAIELQGVYIPSDKCHTGTAIGRFYCRSMRQLRPEEKPQQMLVKDFKTNADCPDPNQIRQLQWAIYMQRSVADHFWGYNPQISQEELDEKEQQVLGDACPGAGNPVDAFTSFKEPSSAASGSLYPMSKSPVNTADTATLCDLASLSISVKGTSVVTCDVGVQTDSEPLCTVCRNNCPGTLYQMAD